MKSPHKIIDEKVVEGLWRYVFYSFRSQLSTTPLTIVDNNVFIVIDNLLSETALSETIPFH